MESMVKLENQVNYGVVVENGTPTFVIKDFDEIREKIAEALKQYDNLEITELNVSLVEKENAFIKKFATAIKQNAKKYVELFTIRLLGNRTTEGQVDILYDILMDKYDEIHEKTKAIRDSKKEPKEKATQITLIAKNEKEQKLIIDFANKHNIEIK